MLYMLKPQEYISLLEEYCQLLDNIAWHREGDILQLAKLAKKLRRNYMQDLAERKTAIWGYVK